MTPKEALDILKNTVITIGRGNGKTVYVGALAKAAEALEKQIPKKVVFTVDHTWGIDSKQPVCPVCDYYLTKTEFFGDGEKITYCDHCGNAIDWRGDNE